MTPERLELPTVRSGVEYATNCAKESNAPHVGLEPTTLRLRVSRSTD